MQRLSSVALYARAWIEMVCASMIWSALSCRPLREGVDRNFFPSLMLPAWSVALYARAWIEILSLLTVRIRM